MRKILALLLIFVLSAVCFVGCDTEVQSSDGSQPTLQDGKLLLNGIDITNGSYVKISAEKEYAAVSLGAVMKSIRDEYCFWEGKNYILVNDGYGTTVIDTQAENFGIPFPASAKQCVRQVVDEQVIVDADSLSAWIERMGYSLSVNYETMQVIISKIEAEGYRQARLVVNGKDITDDSYVAMHSVEKDSYVLYPALKILEEIGAQIKWEDDIILIKYNGVTKKIDSNKPHGAYLFDGGSYAYAELAENEIIYSKIILSGILRNVAKINNDFSSLTTYIDVYNEDAFLSIDDPALTKP